MLDRLENCKNGTNVLTILHKQVQKARIRTVSALGAALWELGVGAALGHFQVAVSQEHLAMLVTGGDLKEVLVL